MPRAHDTLTEINRVVSHLIEVGLADDQNFVFLRNLGEDRTEVTFQGSEYLSVALRDRAYGEIYDSLRSERAYTILLPDGAMLQFSYQFSGEELEKHRLAFWPSPHLEQFQNNPDLYLEDSVFADVVSLRIVPFPIRFDHDSNEDVARDVHHPISHLTLGQYENCRIPLSAPLPPAHFADFILRNFYHTAFYQYAGVLPSVPSPYQDCISENERNLIHLRVPTAIYREQHSAQAHTPGEEQGMRGAD